MFNRKFVLTACIATVASVLMVASIHAWGTKHISHVTFSKAVALPGVVLPAGAYTFEAGPGGVSRNIVMVRASDGQEPVYLGFTDTRDVRQSPGMPRHRTVSFGEAPTGQPTPIVVWYEKDSSTWHEFLYR